MKIVVTGALGHIGSRLIRQLPDVFSNLEFLLLDNFSTQRYCSIFNLPKHAQYRLIEGDIMAVDLEPIFAGADVVIHLAAITDATNSFQNKDQVERVNYGGTERVAKACLKLGCPMIFISTTSVYGTQADVVDENCPESDLKPQSPYAESKLKAEKLIQELCKNEGLRAAVCRFGTIFGTSVGMRFHTAINKFCWQAVMKQPVTVWKTALHQKRPYLDLSDAIRAMIFIIQNQIYDGRVYNVVSINATVQEIIDCIRTYISNLEVHLVDTQIMNQLSYHVLSDRFQKLGFEYKGSLKEGVAETIQLLR